MFLLQRARHEKESAQTLRADDQEDDPPGCLRSAKHLSVQMACTGIQKGQSE
jgi:hypothetical protein